MNISFLHSSFVLQDRCFGEGIKHRTSFFPPFSPSRVPDGAAGVRHRVLQLGRVWGGAAAPPGGRGWLRCDMLPSVGGPEREHERGLPSCSQRVRPLHRVHEGALPESLKKSSTHTHTLSSSDPEYRKRVAVLWPVQPPSQRKARIQHKETLCANRTSWGSETRPRRSMRADWRLQCSADRKRGRRWARDLPATLVYTILMGFSHLRILTHINKYIPIQIFICVADFPCYSSWKLEMFCQSLNMSDPCGCCPVVTCYCPSEHPHL